MRRNKHKHTRRAVAFYKLNYGFHEPFKVLLDGNFIHAAISISLSDIEKHLTNLLGGRVKLYVTRCVTSELHQMGADMQQALHAARRCELHKCGHERGQCTPATCLREAIGQENPDRWWVATQDQALRGQLEQVPACPLVFATINGVHLHQPHELSKQQAKQASIAQQAVPQHERHTDALKDLDELKVQHKSKSIFRRHKAKGPNPLAVKKKHTKPAPQPAPGGAKRKRADAEEGAPAQPGAAGAGRQQVAQAQEDASGGTGAAAADGLKRKRRRMGARAAAAAEAPSLTL